MISYPVHIRQRWYAREVAACYLCGRGCKAEMVVESCYADRNWRYPLCNVCRLVFRIWNIPVGEASKE